jgi:hypothetical protein
MAPRFSDYRFWLFFAALAVAVLVACSSDTSPGSSDSGGSPVEAASDSMTKT